MVADTSFFGRCAVTAVHQISPNGLFRFQAVALPKGIMVGFFYFIPKYLIIYTIYEPLVMGKFDYCH